MIPHNSGFLGMWIPQEVDEAMPGGGKDTLPAILANASGSGLSETGPDQPQDLETRVWVLTQQQQHWIRLRR